MNVLVAMTLVFLSVVSPVWSQGAPVNTVQNTLTAVPILSRPASSVDIEAHTSDPDRAHVTLPLQLTLNSFEGEEIRLAGLSGQRAYEPRRRTVMGIIALRRLVVFTLGWAVLCLLVQI